MFLSLMLLIAGSPITRIPIMAKQPLDLYRLFKLVVERGGLVEVRFSHSLLIMCGVHAYLPLSLWPIAII